MSPRLRLSANFELLDLPISLHKIVDCSDRLLLVRQLVVRVDFNLDFIVCLVLRFVALGLELGIPVICVVEVEFLQHLVLVQQSVIHCISDVVIVVQLLCVQIIILVFIVDRVLAAIHHILVALAEGAVAAIWRQR